MKVLIISLNVAFISVVLPPIANCQSADSWRQRLTDAQRLINSANELQLESSRLASEAKPVLVVDPKLIKETATVNDARFSRESLQNYNSLMERYRAALNEYLRHRQEVREHAARFHAAAQDSNQSSAPLEVPEIKTLRLKVQDACAILQQSEKLLHQTELTLFGLIQNLINNRKAMTPMQFMIGWNSAEQQALYLRRSAGVFDQGVLAKQVTIRDLMHGKMGQAMRDGDYVETQKIYDDENRTSGILHYEVTQATLHSRLAMQFLEQLQAISPNAPPGSPSTQGGSADQFAVDNKTLEKEFEQVQELYKQVQDAKPKFQ